MVLTTVAGNTGRRVAVHPRAGAAVHPVILSESLCQFRVFGIFRGEKQNPQNHVLRFERMIRSERGFSQNHRQINMDLEVYQDFRRGTIVNRFRVLFLPNAVESQVRLL